MPLDATGTFRHNHESAAMHSKAAGKQYPGTSKEGESTGDHTEVHDHGDGTFHTVHPEQGEMQHESIGHLHAELSKLHGQPGHKHFHAHEGPDGAHSHHVESGGEPDHREHEDEQGMRDHFEEFAGKEGSDGSEDEPGEQGDGGTDDLY